ncbi:uncharacterized protein [Ranitomeya imitator]|uniref:uncharacterized protein n=1 Tax=Ranitomeya imitator TaxID=111125 RepID=UPI0037E77AC8
MAVIDLKDAYYLIPIHWEYQKYLSVALYVQGQVKHYQYTALPFGLSKAPRVFTKVMVEVMSYLRSRDIVIVPYLDDFLVVGRSETHCTYQEDAAEGLTEGDGQGGEIQGAGAHSSSQSGARPRVPQSTSHSRRNANRGGRRRASQRAPEQDDEEEGIDVDTLIQAVQIREPLWNMSDRRHADQLITRRLWEEVCSAVLDNWEELDAGAQDLARNRIIVRWRSLRDRFKREFNKEIQAPSGSRGQRSRYKHARALSFLRSTLLSRSLIHQRWSSRADFT